MRSALANPGSAVAAQGFLSVPGILESQELTSLQDQGRWEDGKMEDGRWEGAVHSFGRDCGRAVGLLGLNAVIHEYDTINICIHSSAVVFLQMISWDLDRLVAGIYVCAMFWGWLEALESLEIERFRRHGIRVCPSPL